MRIQIFLAATLIHFGAIALLLWLLFSPSAPPISHSMPTALRQNSIQLQPPKMNPTKAAAQLQSSNSGFPHPQVPLRPTRANGLSSFTAEHILSTQKSKYLPVRIWRGFVSHLMPEPKASQSQKRQVQPSVIPTAPPAKQVQQSKLQKTRSVEQKRPSLLVEQPKEHQEPNTRLTKNARQALVQQEKAEPPRQSPPDQMPDKPQPEKLTTETPAATPNPDDGQTPNQLPMLPPALLSAAEPQEAALPRNMLPLPGLQNMHMSNDLSLLSSILNESAKYEEEAQEAEALIQRASRSSADEVETTQTQAQENSTAQAPNPEFPNVASLPAASNSTSILDNWASRPSPSYSAESRQAKLSQVEGSQEQNTKALPLGIEQTSAKLQNGWQLNWQLNWQGQNQRKLSYLPKLSFPSKMLQGLKDQNIEVIIQVDASGKVVSSSFAKEQLQAYNWQINSALLEKIGQFRFQAQKNSRSIPPSEWLNRGQLTFHFRHAQTFRTGQVKDSAILEHNSSPDAEEGDQAHEKISHSASSQIPNKIEVNKPTTIRNRS